MPDPAPVFPPPGVIEFLSETTFDFTGSNQTWHVPAFRPGYTLHVEIRGRAGKGESCLTVSAKGYLRQWVRFARPTEIEADVDPIWDTDLDVIVGGDASGSTGGWPDGGDGGDGHGGSTPGYGGGGASEVLGVGHGSLWDAPGTGGGSGEPAVGWNPEVLHWNAETGGYETSPVIETGPRGVPGGLFLRDGDWLTGGWGQGALWPWDFAQGGLMPGFTSNLSIPGAAGSGGRGGDGGDSTADWLGEGVGGGGGGGAGTVGDGGTGGGGTDGGDGTEPIGWGLNPDTDTFPRGIAPWYKDVSTGDWLDFNDYDLGDTDYPAGAGSGSPRKPYPEAVGWYYGWGGGSDGGVGDEMLMGAFTAANGQVTITAWWVHTDDQGAFVGIIGPQA